ncbi:NTF2-like protein, partial [Cantharellus anzutake]|uniref:NTF2-like protein n=1 Tax=Cantharellus anzutake TaxID=1750568 RepID=UPI001906DD29
DIANRGAVNFVRVFYSAYDSEKRVETIPKFYRPTSTFHWNGNLILHDKLLEFLGGLPATKHDIHTYDCHAVPETTPPSLFITVTGNVSHGSADSNARSFNDLPRVFSQAFLLQPEIPPAIGNTADIKYYIVSDTFRFVG